MDVSKPSPSAQRLRALVRRITPRRFVVADRSMEPTVVDGQGLIALQGGEARVGQLRCFPHPDRPREADDPAPRENPGEADFWLVKRVSEVHENGTMTVLSDNRASTRADSRTFGAVPVVGSYRVLFRVPRKWM